MCHLLKKAFILSVILLLSFFEKTAFAQEKRYFSRKFHKMIPEKSENVRRYVFQDNRTIFIDSVGQYLVHKGTIYGLTDLDQVNNFVWYCLSNGMDIYYFDYFNDIKAEIEFYNNNLISDKKIIINKRILYEQAWDSTGKQLLINGTGFRHHHSHNNEIFHETFKDSVLTLAIGIRQEFNDTLYYTCDQLAMPLNGLQKFSEELRNSIKYPEIARILGQEARITIEFIVDKEGNLTEFKPLTQSGLRFEKKSINRLRKLPKWNPSIYQNKAVKTKFTLPIRFAISNSAF